MNWPKGNRSDEENAFLSNVKYDELSEMEKIAWVHMKIGELEAPNDENTKLTQADAKIERSNKALEDIFECLWFVCKESPLLLAMFKCWQSYHRKREKIFRFKNQVYKLKKQEEWKRKQAARNWKTKI